MSFESFDFEFDEKGLSEFFDGTEEMPKAEKGFQKIAWEVIHDFVYDYGVRFDDLTIIETTGFTRAKLFFRHNEGVLEFFQNHKWEIAEEWRVKISQKYLSPVLVLPMGENEICIDFFNGTGDKPSLQKALKGLQDQSESGFIFSPGLSLDGDPVFLDAGKNILAGGTLGSGTAALVCRLIEQSLCNLTENVPMLVLIDPQGIDLPVFEKLPNVYGQKVFREENETEEVFGELNVEISRRKKLLEESAAKTVAEYNRGVSEKKRLRQILVIIYGFNSMWDFSENKFRISKIYEKLKILMLDACKFSISFALFTQRPLSEQFCSALDWNFWQTLFKIKVAFRTSDQFFSRQLIGRKDAEYLTGDRDLLCVSGNDIRHLQQYFISKEMRERIKRFSQKTEG